ncbi:hypothetical protein GZH53_17215 [Flavihumibacter sp. R14]|nr:hypothetical protein [Flavihumibacter soli]
MKYLFICLLLGLSVAGSAQELHLKARSRNALSGSAFAASISDSTLSIDSREERIYKEIHSGNVPGFYRDLIQVSDTAVIKGKRHTIKYFVLPDFLTIGSDSDYFYCPMRPALAQRVADLLKCSLPTRKVSDQVYRQAQVKLIPLPIPPTKAMTTVPVFIRHNGMVAQQRDSVLSDHRRTLVAGNKKDIVISNKIYTPDHKSHVVIYGWHRPGGKAIQPLYNGHDAGWADYSHGVRLVQQRIWVDGKKTTVSKVLRSADLNGLLSDEGIIDRPYYPKQF